MRRPWRVESKPAGWIKWRVEATYATRERAEETALAWSRRYPGRLFRVTNVQTLEAYEVKP